MPCHDSSSFVKWTSNNIVCRYGPLLLYIYILYITLWVILINVPNSIFSTLWIWQKIFNGIFQRNLHRGFHGENIRMFYCVLWHGNMLLADYMQRGAHMWATYYQWSISRFPGIYVPSGTFRIYQCPHLMLIHLSLHHRQPAPFVCANINFLIHF